MPESNQREVKINEPASDFRKADELLQTASSLLNSDPERCKSLLDEAMELCLRFNYKEGLARAYHQTGLYQQARGEHLSSIDSHQRCIRIREETGDKEGIGAAYNNIGLVYYFQGIYDKAISYFQASMNLAKEVGSKVLLSKGMANTAMVYAAQKKNKESLRLYQDTMDLVREMNDLKTYSRILDNIGILYMMEGQYRKAISHHKEALKIKKQTGDRINYSRGLGNLGNVYFEQKKYEEALRHYLKAKDLAKKLAAKDILKECYQVIAGTYAALRNFEWAYRYQQLHIAIKDLLLNEITQRQIAEMEVKFEIQTKETQINTLRGILKDKEHILNTIYSKKRKQKLPDGLMALSKREMEVMSYIASGWTDKQISEKIFISVPTIKTHTRRIYSKLLVKNRTGLVAFAHQHRLFNS